MGSNNHLQRTEKVWNLLYLHIVHCLEIIFHLQYVLICLRSACQSLILVFYEICKISLIRKLELLLLYAYIRFNKKI